MQTIELQLFKFDELDQSAKDYAISEYRHHQSEYFWIDDSINSIKAFCNHFDIKLKDYSISPYSYSYIDTNAENHHFRGMKLKDFDREYMPTGYCVDCDLWVTFYDTLKEKGDFLGAFKAGIDAGLRAIIADMEYQDSDEHIAEMLTINEYDFLESGKLY